MKFLFLLILLAVVAFMLGFKRARPPARDAGAKPPAPPAPAKPQDIVACAQCGLHLPEAEALPGRGGQFCSAAHRSQFEAEHGGA
ncbi:MAG: PP0621 family protein [Burkholderiaceae bacterium]